MLKEHSNETKEQEIITPVEESMTEIVVEEQKKETPPVVVKRSLSLKNRKSERKLPMPK